MIKPEQTLLESHKKKGKLLMFTCQKLWQFVTIFFLDKQLKSSLKIAVNVLFTDKLHARLFPVTFSRHKTNVLC